MTMRILKPRLTAALLLVLFLALFREAPRTAADLTVTWGRVIGSGDLGPLLAQVGTPGAGEHVLPPAAKAGIMLLRSSRAGAFRISPGLGQDVEVRQRLVEGSYPIRCSDSAPYLLQLSGEPLAPQCSRLSSTGGIDLVHCP